MVKMSLTLVDKMTKVNVESEMEEGEIVDELDDLSDISSEEEFLLRQRLEVLENYNNVLERKKAKRSSVGPGTKKSKRDVLCDLSEISATELEDTHSHVIYKPLKIQRHVKPHNKPKRKKDVQFIDENNFRRKKDYQRKKPSRIRKKPGVKVISESSDESEDEYRNKRKKLADAVVVHRGKNDKSSLSARLHKMIHGSEVHLSTIQYLPKDTELFAKNKQNLLIEEEALSPISSVNGDDPILNVDLTDGVLIDKNVPNCELIEVSTDDDIANKNSVDVEKTNTVQIVTSGDDTKDCEVHIDKDSDDDLESLRQHALKSKPSKPVPEPNKTEDKIMSDDEDSDTTELRLICLKSALLKKAIEMKQKQKLQKKLSQSSTLEDELLNQELIADKEDSANNTDIESMDMDMGSDTEEKTKDCNVNNDKLITGLGFHDNAKTDLINCAISHLSTPKEEELDDDEDLLRAKLLTSLSKNLPNLVNHDILKKIDDVSKVENPVQPTITPPAKVLEAKQFIIKLDDSDSEGEHEATKNLTKMHMKLSEQKDFQQKLDLFLKSTRMEVEKTKLPDVVQKPPQPKKPDKYVAKAVNNLPKSEQIEYKNLVRRMAELEKMKQTRQAAMRLLNQPKDTLKQRNVTIDSTVIVNNSLEEQIAKSRKTIAEESAKMLKLKEEATKLSQRYKIAATELRNINTAITLNRKQQKTIQNSLTKIRLQHQSLLKSSTTSLHSKVTGRIPHLSNLSTKALFSQKVNKSSDEYKNVQVQKTVKVSVVNDFVDNTTITNPRLSVELDVINERKVVTIPDPDATDNAIAEINHNVIEGNKSEQIQKRLSGDDTDPTLPEVQNTNEHIDDTKLLAVCDHDNKRYYISVDDYKSPLGALGTSTWQADPNAILCPFEVGGQCKDPDCKYLHTSPQH